MFSLGQVNISGLSKQSIIALDHYSADRRLSVLALQETGCVPATNVFTNMLTFGVDADRGVSLSIATSLHPHRITSLEKANVAAIFAVATVLGRPMMFASVYSSPDNNLSVLLKSIQEAWEFCKRNGVPVLHIMGDFNARGIPWGDKVFNQSGHLLDSFCNQHGADILSPLSNTFICVNGGSVIDLGLQFGGSGLAIDGPWTDEEDGLCLFTGAPARGHVPVLSSIGNTRARNQRTQVYNYRDADWKKWKHHVECCLQSCDSEDPNDMFQQLLSFIKEASDLYIPKKTVCRHSKPYWTPELSILSKNLQQAQKRYRYRRTWMNRLAVEEAKLLFKESLIEGKNRWIHDRLSGLNVTETNIFWKRYRSMFLTPEENFIGCLEEDGVLRHDPREKEQILFDTFFGGKHLRDHQFDEDHYDFIQEEVYSFLQEDEEVESEFNKQVQPEEITTAISAQGSGSKSTDGDGVHPVTLKHLGPLARIFLAKLFTNCLANSVWPWKTSIVSFIKKQGKPSYLKPGSFRPISIGSYVGKLFERVMDKRIRAHCYDGNLLDDEQEGFLPIRSTTRYLYRLLATLHENRRRKATAFLLLLDFEKAFDSVPIPCLIYKLYKAGIKGNFLRLIHEYLSSRRVKLKINGSTGSSRECTLIGLP